MKPIHSKSKRALLFSALISLSLSTPFAQGNGHQHSETYSHAQHAHVHGIAKMQMVIAGKDVLIEVASPLFNVVGFEHKPNSAQQKKAFKQQVSAILKGDLITLNAKAQCRIEPSDIDHPFADSHAHNEHEHKNEHKHQSNHAHKHEDNHAGDYKQTHNNMRFEYQLHCENPQNLNDVNTQALFTAWPNLQKLNVEWIYNNRQSAKTLTPEQPLLSLQ